MFFQSAGRGVVLMPDNLDEGAKENDFPGMKVDTIVAEIRRLPPEQRAEVIRRAREFDAAQRLKGREFAALAEGLSEWDDQDRAAELREDIVRGFYGGGDDGLEFVGTSASRG